jgi:hypothetical protein
VSVSGTRRAVDAFPTGLNRFARGEAADARSEEAFAGRHRGAGVLILDLDRRRRARAR